MLVRCWGARGSIAVSGPEYLRYGGNTTCLEIRSNDGEVAVVDAGTGIRPLGLRLAAEGRRRIHVLFTHAHWDHVLGFPFFRPLYAPDVRIELHGCPFAQGSVRNIVSKVMEPPFFPLRLGDARAELACHADCRDTFVVGSLRITPIPLSHPNQGVGYRFEEDGRSFVFLTDNELGHRHEGGLSFDDYRERCRGADLLVHDAEFTQEEYQRTRGWGHSTCPDALRLALEAGVRRFGLFHHNHERTDDAVDRLVDECRAHAGDRVECFGAAQGLELEV